MTALAPQVIIIDDDRDFAASLQQLLEVEEFPVKVFNDPVVALRGINAEFNGVVLLDVNMPRASGEDVLKVLLEIDDALPVILITGHGDIPMAVRALKQGAYGFFTKPLQLDEFMHDLRRALSARAVEMERRNLARQLAVRDDLLERVIGTSAGMIKLRQQIARTGAAGVDALVQGETGSGKEVVARALHEVSKRCDGPFVAINCGNINGEQSAAELFGIEHKNTLGEISIQAGRFERANGGSLLLDEIESMPKDIQIRLLRVLQERALQRVNGIQEIPLDIRILAATKSNLLDLVKRGEFREDLYYRLNVVTLSVPPLRERGADPVILFEIFLKEISDSENYPPVTHELMSDLLSHDWPGNVRELKNAAERYAAGLQVFAQDSKEQCRANSLAVRVANFEKGLIEASLTLQQGSIKRTMLDLDVPRKTLHDKMTKYAIDRDKFTS